MKRNFSYIFWVFSALIIVGVHGFAKELIKSEKKLGIRKASGLPTATLININRLSGWYESNGQQERNPSTGNAGVTYPRGTSTCIYAAGFLWGGQVTDGVTPVDRVNGQSYSVGTVPGAVLGIRTGVVESPNDDEVRIWRIRKDYATADLKQDAAEFFEKPLGSVNDGDVEQIRSQYLKDWKMWPWEKGAPFYDTGYWDPTNPNLKVNASNKILDWGEDVNQNGILDDGEDSNGNKKLDAETPGVADADQVVWYVANDIGGTSPWASPDIGMEMQVTIWGYSRTDALGNMVFKKYKLIYKGTASTPATAQIDSMYLTQWSDPDLGDSGDDFAGCDRDLSLGFIYNSVTLDKEYRKFNIPPPAAGYDFFQGPIIPSPGSTAVFDLKYVPNSRNLPMTSFIYFAAGGLYTDPGFTATGGKEWYQMMKGFPPRPPGAPYFINPITNSPTTFWLSGDPVTKTGWVDGISEGAGDRRMLLTSGPFSMKVGQTQELVTALVAGLGSDRISSISVLKFYDRTAQASYDNLFDLPKPPIQPKITAVALDKAVFLEWEKDTIAVQATETSFSKGYSFEGYNVYQLPSATAPLSSGKKLATYDLITDPATISQEEFDEASGQVLFKPAQLGKNTGLTRALYITNDEIRNRPLVNGQRYYFAVTAYNYNGDPALTAHTFESTPITLEVIPQQPLPGAVLPYAPNDSIVIPSEMVIGDNDASVGAVVFNPTLQTGSTFEVWYGGASTMRNYTIVKTLEGSSDYATVTATLRASNQFPAIDSLPNSKASAAFTINDAKNQVTYNEFTAEGLSSPVTSAHIHAGAAGAVGPVVYTFTTVGNTISAGVWSIPDSLVDDFTCGNLYVNIHTALVPSGEIRGQIADGLFARTQLPSAAFPLPALTTYTEHRLPLEGLSFFVGPAPLGAKSVVQSAPTNNNIINQADPTGVFSLNGPISSLGGAVSSEGIVEIRFNNDVNYAAAVRGDTTNPPSRQVYFIRVPFSVYIDTFRVWPVVLSQNLKDTVWNLVPGSAINGKPVFDKILGIADTVTPSGTSIKYYPVSPTAPFPPTSTVAKTNIVNGTNHVLKDLVFISEKGDGTTPQAGTIIKFIANKSVKIGDIRKFTVNKIQTYDPVVAKNVVSSKVNVFPNPYYGVNNSERTRDVRFVTFSHLPRKATIRIFNLAGILVTTLTKDNDSQFFDWNLTNHRSLPVASGIYIAHIDMGDLGTKILKMAIIMEQQYLQNY